MARKPTAPAFEECRLQSRDFKTIKCVYDVEGRAIRFVYDLDQGWRQYEVNITAPDKHHLFNFDVPGKGRTPSPFLLVLDPYGDEHMTDKIRQTIFAHRSAVAETVGIRYDTGEIVRVGFIDQRVPNPGCPEEGEPPSEDHVIGVTFAHLPGEDHPTLPEAYRKRMPELLNKKRPFYFTFQDWVLFQFIERWCGYRDLCESLVVDLHFDNARLQVSGNSSRTVTRWS